MVLMQLNLEGYEIHEVSLKKKDDQSLGISIVGYNSSTSDGKKKDNPKNSIIMVAEFSYKPGNFELTDIMTMT